MCFEIYRLCVCVCVCVLERKRERETYRDTLRESESHNTKRLVSVWELCASSEEHPACLRASHLISTVPPTDQKSHRHRDGWCQGANSLSSTNVFPFPPREDATPSSTRVPRRFLHVAKYRAGRLKSGCGTETLLVRVRSDLCGLYGHTDVIVKQYRTSEYF